MQLRQSIESIGCKAKVRPGPPRSLQRRADGRLWLVEGVREYAVHPVRCFPWSAPDHHVSLRDDERRERAYIADPAELDVDSRRALEQGLQDAGLILSVTAIEAIEEDYEIRCWNVQTRCGPRSFQTRLETWPRPVPGGGLLLEDVAGDSSGSRIPSSSMHAVASCSGPTWIDRGQGPVHR
ncbi:MAG: DUF1854 domain-containing protein [Myxococcales bacterium]|nr:DUF1854 domain-containing protein [Myxococcales bacterium]